ncbi:MAG: hypothetical protein ACOC71_01080 [Hyphomicrobiales bacterium]
MPQNRKAVARGDGAGQRTEANSEQLRADIDAGRNRDKVSHPDPSAAPLGTDAEAGGAPGTTQSVETNRPAAPRRRWYGAPPPDAARPWLVAVVVAIVVIAGFAWYFSAL